ncbi:MAG: hypothetical protein K2W82_08880 [Candidatus Obscuribacterales bacterium]|nr:hypothetical protein [Candidatus Obscuribacterales bacterium]
MIKLADPVLFLYIALSVLGFAFRFFKDQTWKEMSLPVPGQRLPGLMLALIPLILLALGHQFGVSLAGTLPYFVAASALTYLLIAIKLPSYLRGILLLAGAVALTIFGPAADCLPAMAASLLGLCAAKLADNLLFAADSVFDDILPPVIWLAGIAWFNTADTSAMLTMHASVLLAVISVSLLMRLVQGPILLLKRGDDKIYLKRLTLSVSAGLAVLCILVKLLNLMDMQIFAALCGASFFVAYLLKDLNGDFRYMPNIQQAMTLLIAVGALTLAATRFYGNFGLIAMAPAFMAVPISSAAIFPGFFFAARVLLQVFIQNFNSNVTGINLNHAYTGAAMYAGFLLAVIFMALLKETFNRKVLTAIILTASALIPLAASYLLHSEPTSSLLIAFLTASTMLVFVAPALQGQPLKGPENLILLPFIFTSAATLTHGLLELGNESSVAMKTSMLGYTAVIAVVLLAAYSWMVRRHAQKPLPSSK